MIDFIRKNEKSSDVWITPKYILDALGEFDLDPCCPNNLPWATAKNFYSLENGQDGLLLPWLGRVWLNPPYSNWVEFVGKLKKHRNGIALIFARTETRGFFNHVWNDADSILFIKSRLKFLTENMNQSSSATAPSVLIAYGKNNSSILEKCNIPGKFVRLK